MWFYPLPVSPTSPPCSPHSRELSLPLPLTLLEFSLFSFFLFFPRFSSSHINVFSFLSSGPFTLSPFFPSSLCRDPVGGVTQLGAILGPSARAIPYGEQPKELPRGTILHLQRIKRLLDDLLDLLSALAVGDFHRANRGRALGLEEPHYCHGQISFPRCCLAQGRCFGGLGGSGMGGGWDLEYRSSVALTACLAPFTQVRPFELRGSTAFGLH